MRSKRTPSKTWQALFDAGTVNRDVSVDAVKSELERRLVELRDNLAELDRAQEVRSETLLLQFSV